MISYQKEFETARRQIESAGHSFIEVDLPNLEHSVPVYYVLASAEASTNLARYDGGQIHWREKTARSDLYPALGDNHPAYNQAPVSRHSYRHY